MRAPRWKHNRVAPRSEETSRGTDVARQLKVRCLLLCCFTFV